jgi:hypothetical protein
MKKPHAVASGPTVHLILNRLIKTALTRCIKWFIFYFSEVIANSIAEWMWINAEEKN